MKRFAFTLEPLLKIKVSMEKQLKNKQAELLQRLTSYYKQIQKTEDEKTKVKEEYLSKFGMTAGDMKIFENHYRSLENKRQDLKRKRTRNRIRSSYSFMAEPIHVH
jgi:flagellar biosynthesis chaperone FliJ